MVSVTLTFAFFYLWSNGRQNLPELSNGLDKSVRHIYLLSLLTIYLIDFAAVPLSRYFCLCYSEKSLSDKTLTNAVIFSASIQFGLGTQRQSV